MTLVADELLGYVRTGGIGTATTHLAVALGRRGHDVEVLYVGDPPRTPMGSDWERLYADAGVAVRLLEHGNEPVEPAYFGRMRDTQRALASAPPDVVIVQDLAAPAYTALRLRQLGLAFPETLFVVYCHGTRLWITDTARKARVLPGALAIAVLEQASVELADVVVGPSAYVLDWMRAQRWQLPARSTVIPYVSRSAATGEPVPRAAAADGGRVERIAFFGRLEERKGLRQFAAGLNRLDPQLLRDRELEFVGAATPAWPPDRIRTLLSPTTSAALRSVSFETELDQPAALARLGRPGTLAVMPSLGETFSNAVYECLERGIPFLASDAGAPAELVAPADRGRVLFEPTADGVAAVLTLALSGDGALRPATPAFDPDDSLTAWDEVLAAPAQRDVPVPVSADDWTVVCEPEDTPSEDVVDRLRRAQAASGADVVTCGIRLQSGMQRFFLGDPGGVGLIANHYGTVALVRRSLVPESAVEGNSTWPLLARLALDGARIVSIPEILVEGGAPPGDVHTDPGAALAVVQEFERRLPRSTRSLARLAAGLAAQAAERRRPRRRSLPARLLRS